MLNNTETIFIGNVHLVINFEYNRDSDKRVWKHLNLILILFLFQDLPIEGVLKKKTLKISEGTSLRSWWLVRVVSNNHQMTGKICNQHELPFPKQYKTLLKWPKGSFKWQKPPILWKILANGLNLWNTYMCFPISPITSREKVCWCAVFESLGFKWLAKLVTWKQKRNIFFSFY